MEALRILVVQARVATPVEVGSPGALLARAWPTFSGPEEVEVLPISVELVGEEGH